MEFLNFHSIHIQRHRAKNPNIFLNIFGTSELSFVPQDRPFGSRAHLKDKLCYVSSEKMTHYQIHARICI